MAQQQQLYEEMGKVVIMKDLRSEVETEKRVHFTRVPKGTRILHSAAISVGKCLTRIQKVLGSNSNWILRFFSVFTSLNSLLPVLDLTSVEKYKFYHALCACVSYSDVLYTCTVDVYMHACDDIIISVLAVMSINSDVHAEDNVIFSYFSIESFHYMVTSLHCGLLIMH